MKYSQQDYYDADEAHQQALDNWEIDAIQKDAVDQAEAKLLAVIAFLRANGIMPKTKSEILHERLDHLYPDAASREIVNHEGVKYRRVFKPLKRGKGGGVTKWQKSWVPMS